MIILVDFDGTIVKNAWPGIGRFKFGARRALRWLGRRHYLILWTCREGNKLNEAGWFLASNGIWFHRKNANATQRVREYGGDCRKLSGDLMIDDRAGFVWWPWIVAKVWVRDTLKAIRRGFRE